MDFNYDPETEEEKQRKEKESKQKMERLRLYRIEKQREEKERVERAQRERVERAERKRIEEERIASERAEYEERVERAEREHYADVEEFEFEETPVPKKYVTVMIKMHAGNMKRTLPTFPDNTVVGGTKVGFCKKFTSTEYIKTLKDIYSEHKISVANALYEGPVTDESLERSKELLMKFNHDKVTEEELFAMYKEQGEGRKYRYDRMYHLENDVSSKTFGIVVIHTNVPELKPLELPTEIPINSTVIKPTYLEAFTEFQKINMLNVAVATKLDGIGFEREVTTEYTGIPHYSLVLFSDVLKYFERFGVELVNLIDEGCRIYHKPYPPARTLSFKEKKGYRDYVERTGIGGKRYGKCMRTRKGGVLGFGDKTISNNEKDCVNFFKEDGYLPNNAKKWNAFIQSNRLPVPSLQGNSPSEYANDYYRKGNQICGNRNVVQTVRFPGSNTRMEFGFNSLSLANGRVKGGTRRIKGGTRRIKST